MKQITALFILTAPCSIWALDLVDVYGVNPKTAAHIQQRYEKQVRLIETKLMSDFIKTGRDHQNTHKDDSLLVKKNKLIQQIQQYGDFKYVNFQTVAYPGKKTIYTTIEVISKNQPERLKFITNKSNGVTVPSQHDLIYQMILYQNKAMELLMSNQLDLKDHSCPVYHCSVPFNHPALRPYLAQFNQGAIQQRAKIIQTLNQDPDPQRRAAAAFLIGHFTNPHEIIALLSPRIVDQDYGVRNNILRVIGETIYRAKITELDPLPFLSLLSSPYATDRNKALFILLTIAESKAGKQKIIQQDKGSLLAILRLKQPNNHDIAYLILKKISGKDFGDTNIQGWKQWIKTACSDKKSLIA